MAAAFDTQKLKDAIIEELKTLNAFTDNVLPEYVIAMMENKKTQAQVQENLEVFLQEDTATFVEWLWQARDKYVVAAAQDKASHNEQEDNSAKTNDTPQPRVSVRSQVVLPERPAEKARASPSLGSRLVSSAIRQATKSTSLTQSTTSEGDNKSNAHPTTSSNPASSIPPSGLTTRARRQAASSSDTESTPQATIAQLASSDFLTSSKRKIVEAALAENAKTDSNEATKRTRPAGDVKMTVLLDMDMPTNNTKYTGTLDAAALLQKEQQQQQQQLLQQQLLQQQILQQQLLLQVPIQDDNVSLMLNKHKTTVALTPCRYEPNCLNPNCLFFHSLPKSTFPINVSSLTSVVSPQATKNMTWTSPNVASALSKSRPDVPVAGKAVGTSYRPPILQPLQSTSAASPSPSMRSLVPCKFGSKCERANCWYWHATPTPAQLQLRTDQPAL